MPLQGSFSATLVSWVDDRLAVSRIVMAQRWAEGNIARTAPEPPIPLPIIRSEVQPEEGGAHGQTLFYFEGIVGSVPDRVAYEFQGSFNQEPITSHPNIGPLLKKYGGRLEDGEIVWPSLDPTQRSKRKGFNTNGAQVEGINPMYGVQAYLAIGAIWSVTRIYHSSDIPSSILSGVGTIRNPPGGPPTPSGRNWLKMSPVGRTRGNVLEISDCYMLSGIGGWNPNVYDGSDINGGDEAA